MKTLKYWRKNEEGTRRWKDLPLWSWLTRITVVKWSFPFNSSPGTNTETTGIHRTWCRILFNVSKKTLQEYWIKLYFISQNIYKTSLFLLHLNFMHTREEAIKYKLLGYKCVKIIYYQTKTFYRHKMER